MRGQIIHHPSTNPLTVIDDDFIYQSLLILSTSLFSSPTHCSFTSSFFHSPLLLRHLERFQVLYPRRYLQLPLTDQCLGPLNHLDRAARHVMARVPGTGEVALPCLAGSLPARPRLRGTRLGRRGRAAVQDVGPEIREAGLPGQGECLPPFVKHKSRSHFAPDRAACGFQASFSATTKSIRR